MFVAPPTKISLIPYQLNMSRDKFLSQFGEFCETKLGMSARLAYSTVLNATAEMAEYEYDI